MDDPQSRPIPNGRWLRIVPTLILIYMVAYMDRTNIGFAMVGGMSADLGMTASWTGFAAGIFFIGYMVLQIPGGHVAEKGSAKLFIAVSLVAWSLLTIASGFVQTSTQMLYVRFFMGVAEGGVFPAIYSILGRWFPQKESGRASALFVTNTAFASVLAGPLSGLLLTYMDWRTLFIVEGSLSLCLMLVWWPMISDRPSEAKWISKEELEYLETTLKKEKVARAESEKSGPTSYRELLRDPSVWKLSLIYLCYQTANNAYILWLPTIIKQLTKAGMTTVGFLSAVPFLLTFIGLYIFGTLSDKSLNRKKYTLITLLGFGTCFLLSVPFKSYPWFSFALLAGCGLFLKATISLIWTMPKILFQHNVAGGARGVINAIGNLGGFIGPFAVGWITTMTGNYDLGIYSLGIALVGAALLTASLPKITSGITQDRDKGCVGVTRT
jgi:sugar phosphate permease